MTYPEDLGLNPIIYERLTEELDNRAFFRTRHNAFDVCFEVGAIDEFSAARGSVDKLKGALGNLSMTGFDIEQVRVYRTIEMTFLLENGRLRSVPNDEL